MTDESGVTAGAVTAIRWSIHLRSAPERVFEFLGTDDGRCRFWAESAIERDGLIRFVFPNGQVDEGRVTEREAGRLFALEYFGCPTRFTLESDGAGGTLLMLSTEVTGQWEAEVRAGWVSVLMALKAACDFDVDLRNHDPKRSWDQGFADN